MSVHDHARHALCVTVERKGLWLDSRK